MKDRLSPEAQEALALYKAATDRAWLARDAIWQRSLAQPRPPPAWQQGLAFAAACAVGVMLTTAFLQWRAPSIPPAPAEGLAISPGALLHREGELWVLTRGTVRLSAGDAVRRLKTTEVEVFVQRAQVLVEAIDGRTLLQVIEGSVRWRDAQGEHLAPAGSRVEAPTRAPVPSAVDSLAAETALYEDGLRQYGAGRLAEAGELFREYRRRYPSGVFAPETSVALMLAARARGQFEEARAEATDFLERFPTDPRAGDVAAWREQLPQ